MGNTPFKLRAVPHCRHGWKGRVELTSNFQTRSPDLDTINCKGKLKMQTKNVLVIELSLKVRRPIKAYILKINRALLSSFQKIFLTHLLAVFTRMWKNYI